ncbi:hypothetical protein BG011_007152 [Mortierella polycephala]|uniref:RRM domain-containing protein n=1 Tax=Mortierella polycephala TaxID=41804 RepID=A0A9P6U8X4_9FUNG|nr:hypothetical protein BG011_007152 [Mortierella polycephala]
MSRTTGNNGDRNNSNNVNSGGSSSSPPGTFVTGTKWDLPDRTHAPSSPTTLTPAVSTLSTSWDTLKDQISKDQISGGLSADNESKLAFQANLKKLQAISQVTKKKQPYSPYLLISGLPSTTMPDDIKRMATTKGSIVEIIYHRSQFMDFQNRVTVVFRAATDAVDFIVQKYGKFLGGHKLQMNLLDPHNSKDKRMIPPYLASQPFSGHQVLVSGFPTTARPDHLRTEFRRFNLLDTTEAAIIPVPSRRMSTSSQYLIRLSSRSEAYRFVRTYHNTFYNILEFRKRCPLHATVIY